MLDLTTIQLRNETSVCNYERRKFGSKQQQEQPADTIKRIKEDAPNDPIEWLNVLSMRAAATPNKPH